jgi:copper chaperone CopZ
MKRLLSVAVLLTFAFSAAAATVEFSVAGLTCEGCVTTAREALQKLPGVTKASVDLQSTRARVESTRALSNDEIRAALAKFGFEARFAGDAVATKLSDAERALVDIKALPAETPIDVRKDLAPGKITIIDFWAEWCGPCHVLSPKLERLVQSDARLALRTVDVSQWDSPLGKQLTRTFKAAALPYVRVYAADGKFLGAVVGNDIEQVRRIVAKGK